MNVTAFRIVRIARLVRTLRVVRVLRMFRELRLLVYSILGCMKSLLWTMVLLFLIIYVLAVLLTQVVHEHLSDLGEERAAQEEEQDENLEALREHYASVPRALLTLFQGMSGGADWGDLSWAFEARLGAGFVFLWVGFICLAVFAVLNVVTGVFVDQASSVAMSEQDHAIEEELANVDEAVHRFNRLFEEADADGDKMLSWREFERHLNHERVQAYFRHLDLQVADARSLYRLLDRDGDGQVSVREFVEGCTRYKGQARSVEVHIIRAEERRNQELLLRLDRRFEALEQESLTLKRAEGAAVSEKLARRGKKEL